VRILASVDHPHVVAYLDSFVQSGILHIVMELCEDGDLHSMLHARAGTPLPEPDVWRLYGQSLAGLHHLHSLKILHRDIKSKNLFLSSRGVKLGDLGVARALGASTEFASTMVGTPYYLSPELCNGEVNSFCLSVLV
jgi:NIMA (never in mitosis gene a)-related kinase